MEHRMIHEFLSSTVDKDDCITTANEFLLQVTLICEILKHYGSDEVNQKELSSHQVRKKTSVRGFFCH